MIPERVLHEEVDLLGRPCLVASARHKIVQCRLPAWPYISPLVGGTDERACCTTTEVMPQWVEHGFQEDEGLKLDWNINGLLEPDP